MRLIAKTVLIIGTGAMAAAVAPFLLLAFIVRGAVAAYRWAELQGVYNGDKVRQDRARYLNRIL